MGLAQKDSTSERKREMACDCPGIIVVIHSSSTICAGHFKRFGAGPGS